MASGYVEDAFEGRTPLAAFFSILLGLALEQVLELGEGREGRRSILLPARRRLTRWVSHLISLVLIVVTVETQQLPVASVGRIVVVVVVLVMDRELAQLLAVKFASAVRTDPRKHFERVLAIGLLQLNLGAPCHAGLGEDGDSMGVYQMNQIPATRCDMV